MIQIVPILPAKGQTVRPTQYDKVEPNSGRMFFSETHKIQKIEKINNNKIWTMWKTQSIIRTTQLKMSKLVHGHFCLWTVAFLDE